MTTLEYLSATFSLFLLFKAYSFIYDDFISPLLDRICEPIAIFIVKKILRKEV